MVSYTITLGGTTLRAFAGHGNRRAQLGKRSGSHTEFSLHAATQYRTMLRWGKKFAANDRRVARPAPREGARKCACGRLLRGIEKGFTNVLTSSSAGGYNVNESSVL